MARTAAAISLRTADARKTRPGHVRSSKSAAEVGGTVESGPREVFIRPGKRWYTGTLRYAVDTMKKPRLVRCLGILLVALGVASAAFAQGVDAIIDKHLAAVGGRAALGKLTSRRSTGTITLTTPGSV